MRLHPIAAVIVLGMVPALAVGQAAKTAAASLLNRNLIKNGTAEAPTDDSKKVPAWGLHDGLTEVEYGSAASEWDWSLSGCATCGKRYLRLAFEGDTHELSVSQAVNVAALASGGRSTRRRWRQRRFRPNWAGSRYSDTTGQVIASFRMLQAASWERSNPRPMTPNSFPKRRKVALDSRPAKLPGLCPREREKSFIHGRLTRLALRATTSGWATISLSSSQPLSRSWRSSIAAGSQAVGQRLRAR